MNAGLRSVGTPHAPRFCKRLGVPFPDHYNAAMDRLAFFLWRPYPWIRDPADRDEIEEDTLYRVSAWEKAKGTIDVPYWIRRYFPQAVSAFERLPRRRAEKLVVSGLREPEDFGKGLSVICSSERAVAIANALLILKKQDPKKYQMLTLVSEGYKSPEIARMLETTEANVRQHIYAARQLLQKCYGD